MKTYFDTKSVPLNTSLEVQQKLFFVKKSFSEKKLGVVLRFSIQQVSDERIVILSSQPN